MHSLAPQDGLKIYCKYRMNISILIYQLINIQRGAQLFGLGKTQASTFEDGTQNKQCRDCREWHVSFLEHVYLVDGYHPTYLTKIGNL